MIVLHAVRYRFFEATDLKNFFQQLFTFDDRQNYIFVRKAICTCSIRVLANIQTFNIQCILNYVVTMQYFFAFLSVIYVVAFVFHFFSAFFWFFVLFWRQWQCRCIHKLLVLSKNEVDISSAEFKCFVYTLIQSDGILIIRLIEMYAGSIVACKTVETLFLLYKDSTQLKEVVTIQ